MSDITLVRLPARDIPEADREAARRVLFGAIDGMGDKGRKQWRRFVSGLFKLEPGQTVHIKTRSPRNGRHHRKLMALLQMVADNHETYDTPEKALVAVKLAAGYFQGVPDPRTGEIVPVLDSISYAAMSQEQFDDFYSAALDGVLQVILPSMPRETADALLQQIEMGWL